MAKRLALAMAVLVPLLLLAVAAGTAWGSSSLGLGDVLAVLTGRETGVARDIVLRLRLPRVALAVLAGAGLSLGGMVFQALLRNPLAEPYILGLSGGAGAGAVLGMAAAFAAGPGLGAWAFAGGAAAVALLLALTGGASRDRGGRLLLTGVMLNAFASAFILLVLCLAETRTLHGALFWLMGDLCAPEPADLAWLAAAMAVCFAAVLAMAQPLNLLLLGEDAAASLGLSTRRTTAALILVVSAMAALVVSFCGLLGFVGLVVPHGLRLAFGSDHRVLAPACIVGGGAYLVLCDLAARAIPASTDLPAGVVTALVGAPVFIAFLRRRP